MNNATITLIIIGVMCVMYIVDRFPVALVTLLGMLAMIYPCRMAAVHVHVERILGLHAGFCRHSAGGFLWRQSDPGRDRVRDGGEPRHGDACCDDYHHHGPGGRLQVQGLFPLWRADRIRIHVDERHVPEGYRCIRLFPVEATKERMLARLQEMVGAKQTVTFGSYRGRYDVYIEDANKDLMVKELKRRFEPVSLEGWRNIIR